MRLLVVVTFAALVTAASTAQVMNEYLERNVAVSAVLANGCTINIRRDLDQLQPVYIRNGRYLSPHENSGLIRLNTNEQVTIACTGYRNYIRHPQVAANFRIGNIRCVSGVRVRWQNSQIVSDFKHFTCNVQPIPDTPNTPRSCWNNQARRINVGFTVQNFIELYSSCFDDRNLIALYVSYPQTRENYIYQPGAGRPYFQPGTFFPVDINRLYTYTTHKNTIARITGQNTYINNVYNITRGHLAAKTDFVFATGQSSTFWYINAAPQWSTINSGNWETLEKNLRARIANAGYNTMIYTGTLGVTTLRHIDNTPKRIYLDDSNRVPVPEYFYKKPASHDDAVPSVALFGVVERIMETQADSRTNLVGSSRGTATPQTFTIDPSGDH
ncbi:uncharacterized protein LOC113233543 [Hyposmocoma kahamanoa]|uniref:uncharacterized protein LOC113233543 n=1 Tax=Hyposmocoma kahamanoa TaxID=1477025 RepID=UPI000E6D8C8C|nr:uncharacterized protein LOC113233543 [Hyposmocoma kahamanoa]